MKPEDIEARKAANVLIEYCKNVDCEICQSNACKIVRFCRHASCWTTKYRIPKEKK